ncbi:hypothetical protein QBC34DRAFT_413389 [Podospora aff. communis PSN243]|uniref:Monooxygenase n=1 Tax=Podospora aff. communis PSN243 TaxID=3040156 RepID=A0AAV9GB36_9PEZI|nr:hypothetical protein QBC34DRAFT_413389 [Podospora aff. communis PSN243]
MKSPFKLFPPGVAYRRPRQNVAATMKYIVLRDNFGLLTWIALGAVLQGLASLVSPRYALLPAAAFIAQRMLRTMFMYLGIVRNPAMDEVLPGKFAVQIPGRDGSPPTKPAEEDITVIILASRSNHPLGALAPGYGKLVGYIGNMISELSRENEKHGFLGCTGWTALTEQRSGNQVMVVCYFRTLEDLHGFAHGPLHRKAWDWWNGITKAHPHLSIMHEVYHAPKGHWENIFINNHLTGIANTVSRVNVEGKKIRPLFSGNLGGMRSQLGRLGRGNGEENVDFDVDYK